MKVKILLIIILCIGSNLNAFTILNHTSPNEKTFVLTKPDGSPIGSITLGKDKFGTIALTQALPFINLALSWQKAVPRENFSFVARPHDNHASLLKLSSRQPLKLVASPSDLEFQEKILTIRPQFSAQLIDPQSALVIYEPQDGIFKSILAHQSEILAALKHLNSAQ